MTVELKTFVIPAAVLFAASCGVDDQADNDFDGDQTREYANEEVPEAVGYGNTDNPASTDEAEAEMRGMRSDPRIVTLNEVRQPSDITALVETSFERADIDDDRKLESEEYAIIAPALGQGDSSIDPPRDDTPGGNAMGVGAMEDDELPEGWKSADREEWLTVEGGPDNMMDPQELRDALVERFVVADTDQDRRLEGDEIVIFGRLALAVPT